MDFINLFLSFGWHEALCDRRFGKDVNLLTNKVHIAALLRFIATKEGYKFMARYMKKGDELKIGNKSFKFTATGDRAKDKLWLRTSDLGNNVNGQNSTYTKDNESLNRLTLNENIYDGVNQVIDLNLTMSEEQSTNTLAHEAFVHADKDADALNEMDRKIEDGTYSQNPRNYGNDANQIATSSLKDHQALGRGEVKKYESFSRELVQTTGNPIYLKMYRDDVKRH